MRYLSDSNARALYALSLVGVICASLSLLGSPADGHAESPTKPAAPPLVAPSLDVDVATIVCPSCDQKFEFPGHEEANVNLVGNKYIQELRQAMYWQDTYHQFESQAHFDNCAFGESVQYIAELLKEVNAHIASAQGAIDNGRGDAAEGYAKKAFFSLGQALHATQDLYAHSNYVELMSEKYKKVTEIPILHPWEPQHVKRISELKKSGLVSGYVFWGFPQTCPKGVPSHANLAKDSPTMKSGKVVIPQFENLTQHKVALFLAREASKDLIVYAFERWPLLGRMNGKYVAFEVFQERRGI
ncbi:MAG: hypothetical protein MRJ68_12375 [Nitrospira sp.]|nr:hypothetical protein [Nitrospira sp.]